MADKVFSGVMVGLALFVGVLGAGRGDAHVVMLGAVIALQELRCYRAKSIEGGS